MACGGCVPMAEQPFEYDSTPPVHPKRDRIMFAIRNGGSRPRYQHPKSSLHPNGVSPIDSIPRTIREAAYPTTTIVPHRLGLG